jgi:hypothetical protein
MKFLFVCLMLIVTDTFALSMTKRFDLNNKKRFALATSLGTHIVSDSTNHLPQDFYGFGLKHLGGTLFQSLQPVAGLEILSSVRVAYGSYGKLFSALAKDSGHNGLLLDPTIGIRYLHQLNDIFDLGGQFFAGYGFTFAKALKPALQSLGLAWPLHLHVGPLVRLTLSDTITFYSAFMYKISGLGSETPQNQIFKTTIIGGVNKHGLELPLGFVYSFNETASFFTELNCGMNDLTAKNLAFTATLDIGVSLDHNLF